MRHSKIISDGYVSIPALVSEDLLPLPKTRTKAALFYKPCIVESQRRFWVNQLNLEGVPCQHNLSKT